MNSNSTITQLEHLAEDYKTKQDKLVAKFIYDTMEVFINICIRANGKDYCSFFIDWYINAIERLIKDVKEC